MRCLRVFIPTVTLELYLALLPVEVAQSASIQVVVGAGMPQTQHQVLWLPRQPSARFRAT